MTLGVIDVGTNTMHLLIVRCCPHRPWHILHQEHHHTRLGDGGFTARRLTSAALTRTMRVLRRYAKILRSFNVDRLDAVATSAVRDANNGPAFVRRVREQLGIPLRVVSGQEEARLISRGVQFANRLRRPCVIVSIGGGSAQVMCGVGARIRMAVSVPLGCARLAQRFIHHDPPHVEELGRLHRHVRRWWTSIARRVRRYPWDGAFGSSAAIAELARVCASAIVAGTSTRAPRIAISQQRLRRAVAWLSTSTAAQRMRIARFAWHQERVALPAAVTLLVWMERCGVPQVRYAPGSLREGLIEEALLRHQSVGLRRGLRAAHRGARVDGKKWGCDTNAP